MNTLNTVSIVLGSQTVTIDDATNEWVESLTESMKETEEDKRHRAFLRLQVNGVTEYLKISEIIRISISPTNRG